LFYEGKLWKRYAVYISLTAAQILVEMIGISFIISIYGTFDVMLFELAPLTIFYSIMSVLFVFFGIITIILWKMIASNKFQPYFIMLLIAPIGQMLILFRFLYEDIALVLLMVGITISLYHFQTKT